METTDLSVPPEMLLVNGRPARPQHYVVALDRPALQVECDTLEIAARFAATVGMATCIKARLNLPEASWLTEAGTPRVSREPSRLHPLPPGQQAAFQRMVAAYRR